MGLNQHTPRLVAPTCAARYLLDLLEAAFGRAEVATGESKVRIDYPDQRQVREVIALGDQLRADDDVDLGAFHRSDKLRGALG